MKMLKILSWNMTDATTKLQESNVQEMVTRYDVTKLSTIKSSRPVSFPGRTSLKAFVKKQVNEELCRRL